MTDGQRRPTCGKKGTKATKRGRGFGANRMGTNGRVAEMLRGVRTGGILCGEKTRGGGTEA